MLVSAVRAMDSRRASCRGLDALRFMCEHVSVGDAARGLLHSPHPPSSSAPPGTRPAVRAKHAPRQPTALVAAALRKQSRCGVPFHLVWLARAAGVAWSRVWACACQACGCCRHLQGNLPRSPHLGSALPAWVVVHCLRHLHHRHHVHFHPLLAAPGHSSGPPGPLQHVASPPAARLRHVVLALAVVCREEDGGGGSVRWVGAESVTDETLSERTAARNWSRMATSAPSKRATAAALSACRCCS